MTRETFIKDSENYSIYYQNVPDPILRKSFFLNFKPQNSLLKICVSGFYELYINGKNITKTKGKLAPFISNPNHILYYDEYYLAEHLISCFNVLTKKQILTKSRLFLCQITSGKNASITLNERIISKSGSLPLDTNSNYFPTGFFS